MKQPGSVSPSSVLRLLAVALTTTFAAGFAGCDTAAYCFDCGQGSAGVAGRGGSGGAVAPKPCDGCADTESCCFGACVDVSSSTASCGSCGITCMAPPGGVAACKQGICAAPVVCGLGTADCDKDGKCEATLGTDVKNCGACGTACAPLPGGVSSCVAGKCQTAPTCAAGTTDCNNDGTCEATFATDLANCGKCGNVCPNTTTAPGSCENGICKVSPCKPGTSDCNGLPADGCETKIADDLASCGGCNTACPTGPVPNGAHACSGGACVITCKVGFGDCDGDKTNGCEADLTKDAKHCGSCKGACGPVSNGQPSCVASVCVAVCDAQFGNCNGSYADGCELSLKTDPNNCAACGAKCPLDPNGDAPSCVSGSCSAGTCQLGFDDCRATTPGCETNVATDPLNCGVCGLKCPAIPKGTSKCDFFECVVATCEAGFGNCFGGQADGCETDLNTSLQHCSACGKPCPDVKNGDPECKAGTCRIGACDAGFKDCDDDLSTGCEAVLATDKKNCGGCGLACKDPINGTATCIDGACKLAGCAAGFDSCDGDTGNGCETPVLTDANNCGACTFKCGSGQCQGGKCVPITTFLILRDTAAAANDEIAELETFLEQDTGFAVDVSTSRFFEYDGTNPPLTGYGGLLLLAGAPDPSGSFSSDMPQAGQQAIVDFVNAANGLVMTEWAANYVRQGKWQTLKPFVLLERTIAFSGQVDYRIEPAFKNHPIWAGFTDDTFVVNSAANLGVARLGPGIKRVATSAAVLDPVAILELPNVGRVVHLSHSGDYAPNGWSNPNIRRLLGNSVRWTARQK